MVRFRRDTFIVERNGKPIARIEPIGDVEPATLGDLIKIPLRHPPDPTLADALEWVDRAD